MSGELWYNDIINLLKNLVDNVHYIIKGGLGFEIIIFSIWTSKRNTGGTLVQNRLNNIVCDIEQHYHSYITFHKSYISGCIKMVKSTISMLSLA